jgi:iron uptake system EfeUOB component EfeO/EfeM
MITAYIDISEQLGDDADDWKVRVREAKVLWLQVTAAFDKAIAEKEPAKANAAYADGRQNEPRPSHL